MVIRIMMRIQKIWSNGMSTRRESATSFAPGAPPLGLAALDSVKHLHSYDVCSLKVTVYERMYGIL